MLEDFNLEVYNKLPDQDLSLIPVPGGTTHMVPHVPYLLCSTQYHSRIFNRRPDADLTSTSVSICLGRAVVTRFNLSNVNLQHSSTICGPAANCLLLVGVQVLLRLLQPLSESPFILFVGLLKVL